VPQEWFDICAGVSNATSLSLQPYFRQQVCGMTGSVDLGILRILLSLAANKMYHSTLIVYHSDNGGLLEAGSVNGEFRSSKGAVFEGKEFRYNDVLHKCIHLYYSIYIYIYFHISICCIVILLLLLGGIRVPAFVYGNGLRLASIHNPIRTDLVDVSDILPTILGYAGIKQPIGTFDGYNHWPELCKGVPLTRTRIALVTASRAVGGFTAYIERVNNTTWKYLINPSVLDFIATSSVGETYVPEGELLFDLTGDPYETTNLVANPSVAALLNSFRFQVAIMRNQSVPSQLTAFPPVLNTPPSKLGCWLPLDSPLYSTFTCPVPPPIFPPTATPEDFMARAQSTEDEYNYYVTTDLDM
jgi:hypothetical protein